MLFRWVSFTLALLRGPFASGTWQAPRRALRLRTGAAVVAAFVPFAAISVPSAAASAPSFVRAFGKQVNSSNGSDICTTQSGCQAGSAGGAAGQLSSPPGVAVVGSGDVYVADFSNERVDEYSQSGSFVRAFGVNVGGTGVDVCTTSCQAGAAGGAAGQLNSPYGVAVAGSGDVYVADRDNARIDEFTQSGAFVRAFGLNVGGSGVDVCTTTCHGGSATAAAGGVNFPLAVAVVGSGDVYVADNGNDRIDEFTQSGSFVRAFGAGVNSSDGSNVCTTTCQAGNGSAGAAGVAAPDGVAVAGSGDVYVADEDNYRIDEFTQSGSFVRAFGKGVNSTDGSDACTTNCQAGGYGAAAGELENPEGIAVVGSGDVYVADGDLDRIQEYSQSGSYMRAFGKGVNSSDGSDVCTTSCQAGSGGGAAGAFDLPAGVAVAGSGDVYIAGYNNNRVDEWSPAKATPTLSTAATSGALGTAISDAATLRGANDPGGTITFEAYSTSGCSGSPAFSSGPVTVSNGSASSGSFTPSRPGSYYWTASYSGDSANDPAVSACGVDPNETSTVTAAPGVKITHAKVSRRERKAKLKFRALGTASGFQCALTRRRKHQHKKRKPHFTDCSSPKMYKHLKRGKYTFEVRALSPAGPGPAAKRNFSI